MYLAGIIYQGGEPKIKRQSTFNSAFSPLDIFKLIWIYMASEMEKLLGDAAGCQNCFFVCLLVHEPPPPNTLCSLLTFWLKINQKFFAKWLIHKEFFPNVQNENDLTDEQKESQQIMCWYCWQTNLMCLAHSGGSRGVLSIKEVLAGGKKTKGPWALKEVESANEAITKGNITSHGSKLLVYHEITMEKYEAELSTVKDKVKRKHKMLHKKFRKAHKIVTAKIREEVDDETKMSYHLGECTTGGQFSDLYDRYGEVLRAYARFTEKSVEYEESLPAVKQDNASDLDDDKDESSDNNSSSEHEPCTDGIDYDSLQHANYDTALALLETSLKDLGRCEVLIPPSDASASQPSQPAPVIPVPQPPTPPSPASTSQPAPVISVPQPAPAIPAPQPPMPQPPTLPTNPASQLAPAPLPEDDQPV
ncbi:uncharacterized protein BJ212DRAFT_1305157 [Suillus subaureus]|uniref:Uncharacterized protein n=1 Tax=Suillus subaureus TaxID=48587 RepID=A0A9P7DR81_9AGAM|nr:uncharacterized protein BJ212DRAFT_1305157 [Suillus subaureus]KAG1801129.1 hypothetical protein BJ212DRAFT_1305157 [Suillus subaureus]